MTSPVSWSFTSDDTTAGQDGIVRITAVNDLHLHGEPPSAIPAGTNAVGWPVQLDNQVSVGSRPNLYSVCNLILADNIIGVTSRPYSPKISCTAPNTSMRVVPVATEGTHVREHRAGREGSRRCPSRGPRDSRGSQPRRTRRAALALRLRHARLLPDYKNQEAFVEWDGKR